MTNTSRSTTSETAHLQDGIDIFYTDSGAPPGSTDYTTVIILHGITFTGHNLDRLHSYAHEFNLRTVIWNRRDYAGSTKYSESELDDLKHGRRIFLDRLGAQLAQFLLFFIQRHDIPKVNDERTTGGFAIMGWSLGNTTAISLFSKTDLIHPEAYSLLEFYVKDLIIYDATLFALGWKLPHDADSSVIYEPMANLTTDTSPEVIRGFHAWVSSYYDHPLNPKSVNDLHFAKRTKNASSDNWSPEDLESFHDLGAFVRSELPMFQPPMQATIRELSDCALGIGMGAGDSTLLFPRCPIIYLRPTRTTWRCYWFGIEAQRRYVARQRNGESVRSSVFIPIEGGNHFAHWDMPRQVMETVAFSLRGAQP